MTKPERAKGTDHGYERLLAEEALIVDATELISELMEVQGVSRAELAKRIGKARGFVTQVLAGNRNMTLRTLADLAHSLGARVTVSAQPVRSLYGQQTVATQTVARGATANWETTVAGWLAALAASREDVLAWESDRLFIRGATGWTVTKSTNQAADAQSYGSATRPRLKVIQGRAA